MFRSAILLICVVSTSNFDARVTPAAEPGTSTSPAATDRSDGPFFVAVGYALRRLVSHDGKQWQFEQASPEQGQEKNYLLRGVAYGKGKIVAVGGSSTSRILVSDSQGRDWQDVSVEQNWLGDVAFGNDRFVAVGYRRALHSTDGKSWSKPVSLPQASWRRIVFGNGRFVAVGAAGTTDKPPGFYAASTDGETWTVTQADDNAIPRSVAFGNGRFVAVGDGLRAWSLDGRVWEHRSSRDSKEVLVNVVWTGNEFVAWGTREVYASPDGVEWEQSPRRMPSQAAFGAGTFVGCSAGGFSWSADGRTWTPTSTDHKLSITKIIFVDP